MDASDVIWADPAESPFRLADLGEVVGLMRTRGEDYRNRPGAHALAELTFCPSGWATGRPQTDGLAFTMRDGLGFHFYHKAWPPGGRRVDMLSRRSGEFGETVGIHVGGETVPVFTALFVSLEEAVEVVRRFFVDGGRAECIGWVSDEELPETESPAAD